MMPLNGASPRLPLMQSQRQGSTSTSLIFTIDTKRCRTKSYSQMSTEGIKPASISNQRQEEVLLLSSLNSRKSNETRSWERVWLQQEHILVTVKVSNWIFFSRNGCYILVTESCAMVLAAVVSRMQEKNSVYPFIIQKQLDSVGNVVPFHQGLSICCHVSGFQF